MKEERDVLKEQLAELAEGGSSHATALREREEAVAAYRAEGEALARKQGELEGIIKSLRRKLKEVEADRDKTLAQLQATEAKTEREQAVVEETAEEAASAILLINMEPLNSLKGFPIEASAWMGGPGTKAVYGPGGTVITEAVSEEEGEDIEVEGGEAE